MEREQVINDIISRIDSNWDNLHKIRFVYIELGKLLSKDTDFFFSMDRKLGEANLSIKELRSIYESETGRKNFVICKSAAMLLKSIYDRIGIKSVPVKSLNNISHLEENGEVLDVNHWILAVYDGDDVYFLTLASDLPYIKTGMETKHFGDNISYKKVINGEEIQVYEGEEIKHTVIPRDKLKQVDIDIGYIRNYYSYHDEAYVVNHYELNYDDIGLLMVRDALRGNRYYYELEIYNTPFYKNLFPVLEERKMDDISEEEWDYFERKVCGYVYDKICEILGFEIQVIPRVENKDWNYQSWLLSLSINLEQYIYEELSKDGSIEEVPIDMDHFVFTKWSRTVKKKYDYDRKEFDYDNLLGIVDKLNSLILCIQNKGKTKDFMRLFHSLSFHFIPRNKIFENALDSNGFVSSYYIASKFKTTFSAMYGCGEEQRPFNLMDYSEQVVMIKESLTSMFPELNYNNCKDMNGYNDLYSPVANRIQIYPIKNKTTGDYHIVFNIVGNQYDDDYYFLYDPKANRLSLTDVLDTYNDYYIVSERLKNRVSIDDVVEELGFHK